MREESIQSCNSNLRVSKIMALQKTVRRGLYVRVGAELEPLESTLLFTNF